MDIYLMNTPEGLKPMYDEDFDEKKKLRLYQTYKAHISVPRNVSHHRKYMKLIAIAWAYQTEKATEFFHSNIQCFRKTIEIAAGWCEPVYNLARKQWEENAKSVSFDNMSQDEFDELYPKFRDVIVERFIKEDRVDEFMETIKDF